uniref:Uncharacterized protein n=1 Tax=Arundo donax TaxID=35708 RepID=A0A0A9H3I9_ARUDO
MPLGYWNSARGHGHQLTIIRTEAGQKRAVSVIFLRQNDHAKNKKKGVWNERKRAA